MFFSIVVPTYLRQCQLEECIQALGRQEFPDDRYEVLVVDDGGGLNRDALHNRWGRTATLQLLSQSNAGPATARNLGAEKARGDILVFVDDDCIPPPGWLKAIAARLERHPGTVVGSRLVNVQHRNVFATASDLLVNYLFEYCNAEETYATFLVSGNMAMSRAAFQQIGGFDNRFPFPGAEDRDLCARWLHQGWTMVYAPEAFVYHQHPMGLFGYWRQHFNYGRGASRYRRLRPPAADEPQKVEPMSFYLDLLRFPGKHGLGWRAPLVASLLFLSQFAAAVGFFFDRYGKGRSIT